LGLEERLISFCYFYRLIYNNVTCAKPGVNHDDFEMTILSLSSILLRTARLRRTNYGGGGRGGGNGVFQTILYALSKITI
jgi:hypothetical protein